MEQALIKHPELFIEHPEVELPSKHHMAARLDALGYTPTQICKELGMSNSSLYAISKSPLYKLTVKRIKGELDNATTLAYKILVEASPKASKKLVHIMETSESERLQKEAAVDILKGTNTIHNEDRAPGTVINISESKIALILNTLKELK